MRRYAIKLPDGGYSDGPRQRSVPFEKAKLWTNRGHVLTHLQGVRNPYDEQSYVVEVELTHTERPIMRPADYMREYTDKKVQSKLEAQQRDLQREHERLERELSVLKAKLGK